MKRSPVNQPKVWKDGSLFRERVEQVTLSRALALFVATLQNFTEQIAARVE